MKPGTFEVEASEGRARAGRMHTLHGAFDTPAFMPVGTQASVKGVLPDQLRDLGTQIMLTNTYHLHLRPGDELIRDLGGVHRFSGWDGPILSDSGGFQVFSLAKLAKVSDEGVTFQSHIDGAKVHFTPESVVGIQENLGVDIMMVLDECLPHKASLEEAQASWVRTLAWARRSIEARKREGALLFGIVQGGMHADLRKQACEDLCTLPFDGYAIGGVSVGEPTPMMRMVTDVSAACLPPAKVRYLMGVGTALDIVESVRLGIDMFDCVIPTRSARFGRIMLRHGWFNIKNQQFRRDESPLEPGCDCYTCQRFSRAYISHLLHAKEMLAVQLATLHNLRFYQRLLQEIRVHILKGSFGAYAERFSAEWLAGTSTSEGNSISGRETTEAIDELTADEGTV